MSLLIAYAKGTAPGKWFDRFNERTAHSPLETFESRDPFPLLADAPADAQGRPRPQLALVRLPDRRIDERFHLVRLYTEQPGVAVPKDSELTLLDTITAEDIEDEHLNYQPNEHNEVDVVAVLDALQVVAANVGVVLAPRPLLRVINNKATAHRDYTDGRETDIALVWLKELDNEVIQDFVGIAKGRTPNTSRQSTPKRSAREKTLAKQRRRPEVGKRKGRRR